MRGGAGSLRDCPPLPSPRLVDGGALFERRVRAQVCYGYALLLIVDPPRPLTRAQAWERALPLLKAGWEMNAADGGRTLDVTIDRFFRYAAFCSPGSALALTSLALVHEVYTADYARADFLYRAAVRADPRCAPALECYEHFLSQRCARARATYSHDVSRPCSRSLPGGMFLSPGPDAVVVWRSRRMPCVEDEGGEWELWLDPLAPAYLKSRRLYWRHTRSGAVFWARRPDVEVAEKRDWIADVLRRARAATAVGTSAGAAAAAAAAPSAGGGGAGGSSRGAPGGATPLESGASGAGAIASGGAKGGAATLAAAGTSARKKWW